MDRSETNKTKDIDQQFRQLISEELPTLRGGVYRIVGNAADTDDVIQNAMLRAYRQFDTFKNQASLRTWVYRIAVNCAFDWMRKKKRDSEMLRGYVENVESEQEERRDHHEEEQFQALEKAIAELPETYREAIVWGCLSDLSGHDAAERLGCSENTLYQRVFQAKQILKKTMNKAISKEEDE